MCEAGEHFRGRAERLLQVECDLSFEEELIVEPIKSVPTRWPQDLELHQILEVLRLDTKDSAGLLEFQFDSLHFDIPSIF